MDLISPPHPNHNCIAAGKSSLVYALDERRVLKKYFAEGIDVECQVFSRLGPHPNVVRLLEIENNGLILERGQPLQNVIRNSEAENVTTDIEQKVRWIQQAAVALQHIHNKGIIHADVGVPNMILVNHWLKFIDFEGSSVDGHEATSCYQWFSYRVCTPAISTQTDIFAFGCAMYEIITGRPPHYDLETSPNRMCDVRQRYSEGKFPVLKGIPLREVIQGCWIGIYNCMDDVIHALQDHVLVNQESNRLRDIQYESMQAQFDQIF
ncbi:kinase-like protein [Pseudovirgaria hyperparasitica]|uniref:Kinase-like protein n=1 Tax=Pseudovirgaria hyperparasitica TaxID=470096 RepID=A0A6A6W9K4_9PEZI|nr:kinase-like protein [Pseudovirgaria hyperparasitica]KAF2758630.1 kinase-like protein [Pseudovirgaria hyperparasitica]